MKLYKIVDILCMTFAGVVFVLGNIYIGYTTYLRVIHGVTVESYEIAVLCAVQLIAVTVLLVWAFIYGSIKIIKSIGGY